MPAGAGAATGGVDFQTTNPAHEWPGAVLVHVGEQDLLHMKPEDTMPPAAIAERRIVAWCPLGDCFAFPLTDGAEDVGHEAAGDQWPWQNL